MRAAVLMWVGVVVGSAPVGAQDKQSARISVEVRAGTVHATSELGRTAVLQSTGYVDFGQVDAQALVGVGLLARLTGPLSVRVTLDRAFRGDAQGQWLCAPFVACPAVLIVVDGQVRRWSAAVDLRLTPAAPGWPFEPVAFVGAGWRQNRLRWNSQPDVPIPSEFDESDFFARAGVGASRAIGAVALFAEIETAIGAFGAGEERFIEGSVPSGRTTQVDLGLTAGVRIGIR